MGDAPGADGYTWGKVGPGSIITVAGSVIPISREHLDELTAVGESLREGFRWMLIRERAMRRLKLVDPDGYARLQYLLRLGEAARQDREDREREARRCPCCGCDPEEHGADY